ncbi:hypothetical protein QVD99_005031 [Batrachochytrium dendrobatidis]|nr:hypothetical protein QVD99_005031 [Batrachochytrium dendrobatidis]
MPNQSGNKADKMPTTTKRTVSNTSLLSPSSLRKITATTNATGNLATAPQSSGKNSPGMTPSKSSSSLASSSPSTRSNAIIFSEKKSFSHVKSKVGSLENTTYSPSGGDKKIFTQKIALNAHSKIGSLENINHSPSGGDKKIFNQKVTPNAHSKIGSH